MPVTKFDLKDDLEYMFGLNNYHKTQVYPGIIPEESIYVQKSEFGIYPERFSGTSFISDRKSNRQDFLYRLLPSTLVLGEWEKIPGHSLNFTGFEMKPVTTHWAALNIVEEDDFITGLRLLGGAGEPTLKKGVAIYSYTAGKDMPKNQAFDDSDGDIAIIPQKGALDIRAELGCLRVRPSELCVIPRGTRFHVSLPQGSVRGFVFETYSGHYELPDLGAIGSYCLANAKDFEVPKASYVDSDEDTELLSKWGGIVHRNKYRGSIFNVVAWQGTYFPFKYDMAKFAPIGSLLVDHPDPSTFTILTCASESPSHPAADICLIGPRWIVMENSFRPPRFHRNTMTEFNFIIKGSVDANPMPPGFSGSFSLNNSMSAHGMSSKAFERATTQSMTPERVGDDNMVILFETNFMTGVTKWVQEVPKKHGVSASEIAAFKKGRIPTDSTNTKQHSVNH